MNEEITKAQEVLIKVKIREHEEKRIPIKVSRNTTIMMRPNPTREDIQAKIKKFNKPSR